VRLGTDGWFRFVVMTLVAAGATSALRGDTIIATFDAAGVQAATGAALCGTATACWVGEETFTSWNGSVPLTTTYSTSLDSVGGLTGGISGTYTGGLTRSNDYEWGGAGGAGYYPTVTSSTYTINLTVSGTIPGVNYFGLWVSAIDADNELQFYNGNTLLYTFTASYFINGGLGACPSGSNAFCGNPSNGEDTNEQFAFMNFYDVGGYFTKIVVTEADSSGFETDNHTVGYIRNFVPIGTVFTPEPGSFALLTLGALILMGLRRRAG